MNMNESVRNTVAAVPIRVIVTLAVALVAETITAEFADAVVVDFSFRNGAVQLMSGVSGNDALLTQQIDICTTEWCNSDAIPNDVATT